MTHESLTPVEQHSEISFQRRFEAITDRSLKTEMIDHYAENALNDVIAVVGEVVKAYSKTDEQASLATERAALRYCGLNPDTIEVTLDHIADVAEEIRRIDTVIKTATVWANTVITPPDSQSLRIEASDGSYSEKSIIPRLKTVLFVASNHFGIDLNDSSQASIIAGVTKESMMRGESYNLVELPTLNRSILVCDEEGNATFVLDREELTKNELTRNELMNMSKEDLLQYISQHEAAGIRLVYSENFVENIVSLLETIPKLGESMAVDTSVSKVLQKVEPAPEGVLSARGVAQKFNIHSQTFNKAVMALADQLGEVKPYRFANRARTGYTPAQQKVIEDYLEAAGVLAVDAEEGTLSFSALHLHFGVSKETLGAAIEAVADELGEVRSYRVGEKRKPTVAYTLEQQEIVAAYLRNLEKLKDAPAEGVLSVRGVMKALGKDWYTIQKAINILGDELGEVSLYKFHSKTVPGYNIEQQAMIKDFIEPNSIEEVPDGFVSPTKFAVQMGTSWGVVERAIAALGENVGPVLSYREGGRIGEHLSPEQQQQITSYLEEKGLFAEEAPEGFIATSRLARDLKVSHKRIKEAIDMLGDELGELQSYRFGKFYTAGLSPIQKQKVEDFIGDRKSALKSKAPEGVLSTNALAQQLGVDRYSVTKAVELLKNELGEVSTYMFRHVVAKGYNQDQQKLIQEWIGHNTSNKSVK